MNAKILSHFDTHPQPYLKMIRQLKMNIITLGTIIASIELWHSYCIAQVWHDPCMSVDGGIDVA